MQKGHEIVTFWWKVYALNSRTHRLRSKYYGRRCREKDLRKFFVLCIFRRLQRCSIYSKMKTDVVKHVGRKITRRFLARLHLLFRFLGCLEEELSFRNVLIIDTSRKTEKFRSEKRYEFLTVLNIHNDNSIHRRNRYNW